MDAPNAEASIPEPELRRLALSELPALRRLARNVARDPSEADDLVQETYLRAFKARGSFAMGPRGVRPWLFTILVNALRTRIRNGAREAASDFEREPPARHDQPRLAPHSRLSDLDWEQVGDELKHAVLSLPAELKMTFLLFAVEDLKYREIAEVTGVPVGTVMSRLSRARKLLASKLSVARQPRVTCAESPEDSSHQ